MTDYVPQETLVELLWLLGSLTGNTVIKDNFNCILGFLDPSVSAKPPLSHQIRFNFNIFQFKGDSISQTEKTDTHKQTSSKICNIVREVIIVIYNSFSQSSCLLQNGTEWPSALADSLIALLSSLQTQ